MESRPVLQRAPGFRGTFGANSVFPSKGEHCRVTALRSRDLGASWHVAVSFRSDKSPVRDADFILPLLLRKKTPASLTFDMLISGLEPIYQGDVAAMGVLRQRLVDAYRENPLCAIHDLDAPLDVVLPLYAEQRRHQVVPDVLQLMSLSPCNEHPANWPIPRRQIDILGILERLAPDPRELLTAALSQHHNRAGAHISAHYVAERVPEPGALLVELVLPVGLTRGDARLIALAAPYTNLDAKALQCYERSLLRWPDSEAIVAASHMRWLIQQELSKPSLTVPSDIPPPRRRRMEIL